MNHDQQNQDKAMVKPNQLPDSSGRSITSAVALTALHFLLWTSVLLILLFVVPRSVETFHDFGMELPSSLKLIMQIGHVVAAGWYLFVIFGLVGLALDFGLLLTLRKRSQLIAGLVLTLVPLLLGVVVLLGIWLPLDRLLRNQ